MRASGLLIATGVALAVAACGDATRTEREGQILLHFDTDAPLPAGPDQPASVASPLFDRLRIELYRPGEDAPCAECAMELEVDAPLFEQRRASIGIAAPAGVSGYRARARLFRRAFVKGDGEPYPSATIDVTVALPAVKAGEVTTATVALLTDDVERPVGTPSEPTRPRPGPPERSLVGTWAGAARVDCEGRAPDGAVCVPGGAFWMGSPDVATFAPERYFSEPRLVVLSPFFMSATEVTVREFRASGRTPNRVWSGSSRAFTSNDWCTFSTSPDRFEDLPVTCVTFSDASGHCAATGGQLPTEAQFEYVAGDLTGAVFPWGQDAPSCTDAIFGRAGWGMLAPLLAPCKEPKPPGSAARPGSGTRDRVVLPGGELVDLAGNVTEWTRDLWNGLDEPCWSRPGVHRDPWCTTVSPRDGLQIARRGGNWMQTAGFMQSHARAPLEPDRDDPSIGFRCVWPAH